MGGEPGIEARFKIITIPFLLDSHDLVDLVNL